MAYRNGQLPSTALHTVAPGVQLVNATANAYRSLTLIAAVDGIRVAPAPGVGSGYRSIQIQRLYWAADHGDKAAQAATKHTPGPVPVAAPGYSSHGTGTRIDLVFNGSASPNSGHIELAEAHGWKREFGAGDPNHFKHDGATAISGPNAEDQNRIKAHFLNSLGYGKQTATEQDGEHSTDPGTEQIYTWLLQTWLHNEGLYPTPTYKVDGKWGPRTSWGDRYLWQKLWTGKP